ncbi:MAG: hemerythrin family protein [Deltaproteobacteria bacterium]|nr:hemerythrin family protein [Deltaproteobacteria bacterium]
MKVEWQEYLSVGVEEIDRQHKLLFEKYNAFFTAYHGGRGDEEVIRLFGFLEEYMATHFADEESLQKRVCFPDYQRHREKHLELTCKVAELKERLYNEGPDHNLVTSAGLLMTGWLIEHISVMDHAIARYVKASPIQDQHNT